MREALHSLDEWGWVVESRGGREGETARRLSTDLSPSLPSLVPPAQGTPTNVFVKNKPLYAST